MSEANRVAAPLVKVQGDGRGVLTLTLNDPNRLNVLSADMLKALQAAVDQAAQDPALRVLVLAAEGKAFCAGHDLKAMAAGAGQEPPSPAHYLPLFQQCSRFMLSLLRLPVPVVARVQGVATAAGCQLVAQCDLAVASEGAQFATSGIRYGLFCATPSVPLLRTVGAKQAMEMLMTGEFISAETAQAQGLVNRVASPEDLDAALEALVQSLLKQPKEALAMGKALVYQQRELGWEAAYQLAAQTMAVNMAHAVAQEGALAFVEKRSPAWSVTGA
jgi:enoyl-CoA hydratase/carnithine racemase